MHIDAEHITGVMARGYLGVLQREQDDGIKPQSVNSNSLSVSNAMHRQSCRVKV